MLPKHWSGEPFSYAGQHFSAREVIARPRPPQQPIPIWIGGNSKLTRRRVAQRANGWMPMLGPDELFATARTAAMSAGDQLASAIAQLRADAGERGGGPRRVGGVHRAVGARGGHRLGQPPGRHRLARGGRRDLGDRAGGRGHGTRSPRSSSASARRPRAAPDEDRRPARGRRPRLAPVGTGTAVRRRVRAAGERHGYAGIAFTDHPAPTVRWTAAGGEGSADPLVSLAYCAAVTSSIELMTFVLALPYHNPLRLAHQAATLDALSGGRLTLGLGTGYLRGRCTRWAPSRGAAHVVRHGACDNADGLGRGVGFRLGARLVGPRCACPAAPGPAAAPAAVVSRQQRVRAGAGGPLRGRLDRRAVGASSWRRRCGPRTCRTWPRPGRRWRTCIAGPSRPGAIPARSRSGLAACGRCLTSARATEAGGDRRGGPGSEQQIELGRLFTTICGDDPAAATTLAAFGEQVVGAVRDIGIDIRRDEPRRGRVWFRIRRRQR